MAGDPQAELFSRAREAFRSRGLLGRALRLELRGRVYNVRCDEDCFSVYRVNERPHLPPGLPGWMVCRLGAGECFSLDAGENACPLPLDQAHLDQAREWVELMLGRLAQGRLLS